MKKILNITIVSVCFFAILTAAQFDNKSPNALAWYGYNSLLSTGVHWSGGMIDDGDDQVFRKRRHRRKRKISPPKKGW